MTSSLTTTAAAVVLMFLPAYAVSTTGHHGDTHCERLHTGKIQHSDAHCLGGHEGVERSPSCSAVVSFDLPQGFYAHNARVTTKPAAHGFQGAVAENFEVGVHVVHSQDPAGSAGGGNAVGSVGRLPSKLSEDDGIASHNAVTYSIATRVVEQYPEPSKLQVQVRYGDTNGNNMLENMPNPADDAPEWSSSPSSQEIHRGGREIELDVLFCPPADDRPANGHGLYLEPPSPVQHRAGVFLPQRVVGQTVRAKGRAEPISLASDRKTRKLSGRSSGQNADGGGESVRQEGAVGLRGGARDLQVADVVAADAGSCDPYDGGDEWCEEAISVAEQRALGIQETEIYCSRECMDHSALWCDIFGKKNCRMCSNDCEARCLGKTNCRCHPCPVSGASETWACTVGKEKACYDQITESDYKSMVISQKGMQCTWSCLREGGLWCQAFGIDGCRFCSLDCDEYCSSNRTVFGENCDCVQCPDDLADPPFEVTTNEEYESCADADDGHTFCSEQVTEETRMALETQGINLECHEECYPGVAWPVWCFAEETVGCRYCKESCDEYCGAGVPECNSCYTCEGSYSYSYSYSFQDNAP